MSLFLRGNVCAFLFDLPVLICAMKSVRGLTSSFFPLRTRFIRLAECASVLVVGHESSQMRQFEL